MIRVRRGLPSTEPSGSALGASNSEAAQGCEKMISLRLKQVPGSGHPCVRVLEGFLKECGLGDSKCRWLAFGVAKGETNRPKHQPGKPPNCNVGGRFGEPSRLAHP